MHPSTMRPSARYFLVQAALLSKRSDTADLRYRTLKEVRALNMNTIIQTN